MSYVDGFLLPVPKKNLDAYAKMAREAGAIWREHGALQYIEAVADDVSAGTTTDFFRAVKLEEGETVVYAFIVYRSRAHRDEVNAKVMADPRLKKPDFMPFDDKRMMWGGFQALVEL